MEKNTPEKKFKAGAISATVWKNQAKNPTAGNGTYYTIGLDRRYMDKDGKWQSTTSFRLNDLPKVALVMQKAYEHIVLKDTSAAEADESDSYGIY